MSRGTPRPSCGSRAFHQKSRHGCKRCKERRVKCNAQRPICNHCNRRNEHCSYQDEEVGNISYTIPMEQALPIVQFSANPGRHGLVYRIPISKPVLLSAFFREVMNEIRPASPHEVILWRASLEKSSLVGNDFLWHSLSALHMLHQGRHQNANPGVRFKMIELAYQHHIQASRIFSSMKPDITQHNWPIFLGFAISVIVCQLATQTMCPDPFFDYIEMFQTLRASSAISDTLGHWLHASEMWPLIQERTSLTEEDKMQDHGLQYAFTILDIAIENDFCVSTHGDCMRVAMQCLKDWVNLCEARPRRWHQYVYWPAVVPAKFIEALKNGNELALVLLLHWLAIIRLAPSRWFLEHWLIRTADHVLIHLSQGWGELKAWPTSILYRDRKELLNDIATLD